MSLDVLLSDLQYHVDCLESCTEPRYELDREQIYGLEQQEKAASSRKYDLTQEEMLKAAQMAPVFSDMVARLSPAELEDRLETAQANKDGLSLYLLSRYAPAESIRNRAMTLGPDRDILSKIGKARGLYARVRQLEDMQPQQRRELARALGHQVKDQPAQQPGGSADVGEHYRALKASGMYGF